MTQEMEIRKFPSPRNRTVKDDAEEIFAVGVKNMTHEGADNIRADLRMVLTDGVRVLHVRYLQENHMQPVKRRHQYKALKDHLISIGYKVMSGYSRLSMQVRRELDEDNRARRKAYCAARVIERSLKGNLGRSVITYYENSLVEVKGKFPDALADKGKDEFNLEYGVRVTKQSDHPTSKPGAKVPTTAAGDSSVPGAK